VSLTVAPGEVVGLIGPNGAGKTTLLDLISGYLRPDTGHVRLDAHDLTGASPTSCCARVGSELPGLSPVPVAHGRGDAARRARAVARRARPPQRCVPAARTRRQRSAARHRVDELIELLGLEAFRTKFIGELSTGSRRVVDLGCVLAHEPSVVLLDEPSSGIAQREAEALGPLLLRIRDALGASLVVIEHDMSLIASVSDRLIALDQGRVVTAASPSEVLAHPEVVASYLGGDAAVLSRSGPTDRPPVEPA
jgi:ABC-type branched-subunit amino acid transport system ATPase component